MSEKLKAIFEVIAQEAIMGIMAFEVPSMICSYSNKLARETLNLPLQSGYEGRRLQDLYPTANRGEMRAFSDDIIRREGLSQDIVMKRVNDSQFIANLGVKNMTLEDGRQVLLLMFQDITFQKKLQRELTSKQDEIKKAYSELLEQNAQLKELDHAKDKFIALTTHELRTPLSAIVATAEVLDMKLYDSEEQRDEFIHTIYEQGLHLMEIVNDVLDFAKIRAGKMDYFVEHRNLNETVKTLVDGFSHMADHAQVKLNFEPAVEDFKCYYDVLRFKEVINNVVSNAIKYNRKEGGEVFVTLEQIQDGKLIRLSVRDTGQGIPDDKVQHVFNEFETVGSVSRHHKGTGLGMPISKRLMQGMGGDLTLRSEEGVGTTFFVDIPTEKVLNEDMYRSRPDAWGDLAA